MKHPGALKSNLALKLVGNENLIHFNFTFILELVFSVYPTIKSVMCTVDTSLLRSMFFHKFHGVCGFQLFVASLLCYIELVKSSLTLASLILSNQISFQTINWSHTQLANHSNDASTCLHKNIPIICLSFVRHIFHIWIAEANMNVPNNENHDRMHRKAGNYL